MAKTEKNKELTRAEEQVMHELWSLNKAFVKEVVEKLPEPKPAYNTVSTIIRILEKKGFVGHEAFGKSHRYFPLVSKEEYAKSAANKLMTGYFGNSVQQLLSFFVKEKQMTVGELNDILKELKEEKGKE